MSASSALPTTVSAIYAPEDISRSISTPDGPVHYLDTGDGPPLLLVPAFGPAPGTTGWLIYRHVLAQLSGSRRCIVVEPSNFGLTGPVVFHEPGHDVTVRAVVAVLDHLGIDKLTAVGVSMGGTVAIDLAIQHPARVDGLVIGSCHASTGGDPYLLSPGPSEAWRRYEETHRNWSDREALARFMQSLVFDEQLVQPDLVDEVMSFRADRVDHFEAMRASTSVHHSNVDGLRTVQVPVLLFHGKADRMVPVEQALMIMSHLPQADLVIFNECGHWPPVERPEAFADMIENFLDSENHPR